MFKQPRIYLLNSSINGLFKSWGRSCQRGGKCLNRFARGPAHEGTIHRLRRARTHRQWHASHTFAPGGATSRPYCAAREGATARDAPGPEHTAHVLLTAVTVVGVVDGGGIEDGVLVLSATTVDNNLKVLEATFLIEFS